MTSLIQSRKHRAQKAAWLLQIVPFIRFVGLSGSLAYDICKESSDIDLFMIAKSGRIWTMRFFAVVLLKASGLYRKGNLPKERAGKICANRYVSDQYLLINPQNRYHAQDYTQMIPLYDSGGVYNKFLKKNEWMQKYGFFPPRRAKILVQSAGILSGIRKVLEWILSGILGDHVERAAKKFQLKSIMKDPMANKPESGIHADDNEIRIHPRPR